MKKGGRADFESLSAFCDEGGMYTELYALLRRLGATKVYVAGESLSFIELASLAYFVLIGFILEHSVLETCMDCAYDKRTSLPAFKTRLIQDATLYGPSISLPSPPLLFLFSSPCLFVCANSSLFT